MARLLFVEDNHDLASLLVDAAQIRGHQATAAHSGQEALSLLRAANFDAAVVDLLLPDIRGSDVLAALREHTIPAIAVSGVFKGERFAREATEVYGARAFFEKPFELDSLLRSVETLCALPPPPLPEEDAEEPVLDLVEEDAEEPSEAFPYPPAPIDPSEEPETFDALTELEVHPDIDEPLTPFLEPPPPPIELEQQASQSFALPEGVDEAELPTMPVLVGDYLTSVPQPYLVVQPPPMEAAQYEAPHALEEAAEVPPEAEPPVPAAEDLAPAMPEPGAPEAELPAVAPPEPADSAREALEALESLEALAPYASAPEASAPEASALETPGPVEPALAPVEAESPAEEAPAGLVPQLPVLEAAVMAALLAPEPPEPEVLDTAELLPDALEPQAGELEGSAPADSTQAAVEPLAPAPPLADDELPAPDLALPFAQRERVWNGASATQSARRMLPDWCLSGELEQVSFPRLLNAFYEARATGELKLRQGSVLKLLYFHQGKVAYAASNLAQERFGRFCMRRGVLSEEQAQSAAALAREQSLRTSEALQRLGLLEASRYTQLLAEQVREIGGSLLGWTQGTYVFMRSKPPAGMVPLEVSPSELLLEGVLRHEPLVTLRQQVARERRLFAPPEAPYVLLDMKLSPPQARLLANADGTKTVEDLLSLTELTEREALATLRGLELLGMLQERAEPLSRKRISFGL